MTLRLPHLLFPKNAAEVVLYTSSLFCFLFSTRTTETDSS